MTNSDAVRIASRALALYLFIVAATSGIGLLSSTVSLVQAISDSSQIKRPSKHSAHDIGPVKSCVSPST